MNTFIVVVFIFHVVNECTKIKPFLSFSIARLYCKSKSTGNEIKYVSYVSLLDDFIIARSFVRAFETALSFFVRDSVP